MRRPGHPAGRDPRRSGLGEVVALAFLALRWARIEDANLRYTQPLPLLIELRDYGRWQPQGAKDFTRFLHEASTWHRLNQITLNELLLKPRRVMLLLDGLDEIFDPKLRGEVLNDIHRFSNQYPAVRIVVTSRVVGYKQQRLGDAEFRHFMLQDLSLGEPDKPGQIDVFLDRWHDVTFDDPEDAAVKRRRLARAIRGSRPIAELAGNPLLLTMMAILNRHQELPRDRVELYQQATRVLLQQWDTERALEGYPELRGQVTLREKTDRADKPGAETSRELVAAANDIGTSWPRSRQPRLTLRWHALVELPEFFWAEFVAAVLHDRTVVEKLASADRFALRWGAYQALAEKWPDETTRRLLTERPVQDEHEYVRSKALQALAAKWPDQTTRKLFADRVMEEHTTGIVAEVSTILGEMHSEFGRILWTRDLDGFQPYRDPREPISREQIERAAQKAGIPAGEIDETVRSLSEHMGWDVTRGVKG